MGRSLSVYDNRDLHDAIADVSYFDNYVMNSEEWLNQRSQLRSGEEAPNHALTLHKTLIPMILARI